MEVQHVAFQWIQCFDLAVCVQILFTMWQYKDMHPEYKRKGWKEQHFVTKSMAAK